MPEGHKTHYLARQHSEWFGGQPIRVTSPQGRFRSDARKVSGKILEQCEAVGKHLFYQFENGRFIHIHLGRYGRYRVHDAPPPVPVGKVRMRMVGSEVAVDLSGPTTCRVIDADTRQEVIDQLGPDPLAGGRKSDVWKLVQQSGKPIGAILLDQKIVAGVGNIFRAELLFELGMDPNIAGSDLEPKEFDEIWRALVKMMRTGLRYGKIVTVTRKEAGRPLAEVEGKDRFRIYGKEVCPRCENIVEMTEIASRKLYWCSTCQA